NPYLAFETIQYMVEQKLLDGIGIQTASKNYVKAVVDGIVKVMSKMGISTLQSYHGAQIFEAVGLGTYLVQRYFPGTPSRIEGIGLEAIAREVQIRMDRAYAASEPDARELEPGGQYKFRNQGEHHLLNPSTVHKLRLACRTGDYELFKEYSNELNADNRRICTIRGLLGFRYAPHKIPLEEVEPVEEIVKRFKTSAMSYGSISEEAHKALALAMNSIGGKSNSGEGGEDMERYTGTENGISLNSAIKQVASGRFGVTSLYLVNANEIQIKIAQGAKPGEGGQLPGHKVYPWIARVRYSTPGVGLISPPPHHDIYSIEDLEELIYDLRSVNPGARISVKLVSEVGVGTIAAGVAKARADAVLISGYDGGTGAAPLTSIKHAGLPWELGLAETHQTLLLNNLRNRIIVETDGKLLTGRDVVIAALLGAEEFGFATGPLIALGCVMMRACHLNTCPVGIATQDPQLRKLFDGKPEYVVNFMRFVAQEVREIMAQLGFRRFSDMVGRVDRLEPRRQMQHWKAKDLDLSKLLYRPDAVPAIPNNCGIPQDQDVEKSIDKRLLLKLCAPAIKNREPVRATLMIRNVNRATGALLGGEISKRYGAAGLPDDTIRLKFKGSAGQSFGAFIPRGVTFVLEGDANDYVGKGLSGGRIIVYPPKQSPFRPDQSVVIGNVAFYGGTSGEAYINGVAGERFCVRNSGVHAVVEAVGDHGCEYMTGGRVIILGKTGRNFAAGMTGGIAYVLDPDSNFAAMCNTQTVTLERLQEEEEIEFVRQMIQKHSEFTGSIRAAELLEHWPQCVPLFVKVMPNDYKKVLESLQKVTHKGADDEDALMAAFTENANVVAHLSTR
ncbi:MAG: glutamate synthase-related protein, partial [Verrucomicrobiae bacterium]|nr:glutamate synthase-related protein [Verrucomicrobiae bacterium]